MSNKKVYGIDLGTSYSLIGRGDTMYTGLVSSNVDLGTMSQVSRDVTGSLVRSGYKVDMTTGKSGEMPIKASTIILKDLAAKVEQTTGEKVEDVIISVPAKFSHTQRQAVMIAGKDAGLNVRGIVNEPTAAALYACQKPGLYMVFDLGGGTFDITILDTTLGNAHVLCTDGIGHLGGNDFDDAIIKLIFQKHKVVIRKRTDEAMQQLACDVQKAKEDFQRSQMPQYIPLRQFGLAETYVLTKEDYLTAMEVFKPTIVMARKVMGKLLQDEIPTLIFVGGSTNCPFLRQWVAKELNLPMFIPDCKPDFTVAKGVAVYAKKVEDGMEIVYDVTKQLSIEDVDGVGQVIIEQDTPVPAEGNITATNHDFTDVLRIKLYQGTELLCSKNDYIGTLEFNYGRMVEPGEGAVDITVTIDVNGIVELVGIDLCSGAVQNVQLKAI